MDEEPVVALSQSAMSVSRLLSSVYTSRGYVTVGVNADIAIRHTSTDTTSDSEVVELPESTTTTSSITTTTTTTLSATSGTTLRTGSTPFVSFISLSIVRREDPAANQAVEELISEARNRSAANRERRSKALHFQKEAERMQKEAKNGITAGGELATGDSKGKAGGGKKMAGS